MKVKSGIAAVAMALAVGSVLTAPSGAGASDANPTYESVAWPTQSTKATAFILRSSGGLLNLAPQISLGCANGQAKAAEIGLASVNPGANTLSIGKMTCNLTGNLFDDARATLADLSLFGGLVRVRGIDSHCFANQFTDTATVGSVEATVLTSDNYTRNGSGGIVLPNGAVVYFNVKYLSSTKAGTVAVTVHIPSTGLTPATTLLIGGCELSRSFL